MAVSGIRDLTDMIGDLGEHAAVRTRLHRHRPLRRGR